MNVRRYLCRCSIAFAVFAMGCSEKPTAVPKPEQGQPAKKDGTASTNADAPEAGGDPEMHAPTDSGGPKLIPPSINSEASAENDDRARSLKKG